MQAGAIFGTASMLDGMVQRLERQMGAICTVVVTGPMADIIVPCCQSTMIQDPMLLLKGLRRIYEKNNRK